MPGKVLLLSGRSMAYKLIRSQKFDLELEEKILYLLVEKQAEQGASHLADEVENIYSRLQENPGQFPYCRNRMLKKKGYQKAILAGMDYVILFKVDKEKREVHIDGIFHDLEDYKKKI